MTDAPSVYPSDSMLTGKKGSILIGGGAALLGILLALDMLPAVAGRWLFTLTIIAVVVSDLRSKRPLFLVSPLFLLAAVTGIAYSIVPVTGHWLLNRFLPLDETNNLFWVSFRPHATAYFGDISEKIVLAFASICAALHAFLRSRRQRSENQPFPELADRMIWWLFGFSAFYSLVILITGIAPLLQIPGDAFLKTALGPFQSIVFLYFLHLSLVERKIGLAIPITLGGLAVAALFSMHAGKIPIFMLLAALLYSLYVRGTRRLFWRGAVLFPIILVFAFQLVQVIRAPHASIVGTERSVLVSAAEVVSAKIVWRQMETGYCLRNLVKQHRHDGFKLDKQYFWIEILVPRALWPDKRDFSLGSYYAHKYCEMPEGGYHSASITLLGQPIVMGGIFGALIHGAFLICILTAGAVVAQISIVGRVFVMSLLPWWLDFDQDFALYIGHLVKFSFIMLPVILYVLFAPKRASG